MTDPDMKHPTLEGKPVMIGDLLHATDPDYGESVEFHVGAMFYDAGVDLNSNTALGWTVAPIDSESIELPFEFLLSECCRPAPKVDGFTVADRLGALRDGEVTYTG